VLVEDFLHGQGDDDFVTGVADEREIGGNGRGSVLQKMPATGNPALQILINQQKAFIETSKCRTAAEH
jgi:hypothetical protein